MTSPIGGDLPPGIVAATGDGLRDYDSVLNKSSQRLMNSDVSSSTLGKIILHLRIHFYLIIYFLEEYQICVKSIFSIQNNRLN